MDRRASAANSKHNAHSGTSHGPRHVHSLEHHERLDGKGYPYGLAGESISLHGRIFAVADVHDALISDRPYRKGMPMQKVMAMIREGAGTQFDPRVVDAFFRVMARGEATDWTGAALEMVEVGEST